MGGIFSKPKVPPPPAAPPPSAPTPTVDEAQQSQVEGDRLRRRRGRAATMMTGSSGDTSGVRTGTKTLLGT